MIEHGHATHTGLRREHNEDNYWADAQHGLWLLADGMGGHARGEVASAIALDATLTALRAGVGLADALRRAGAAILGHPAQRDAASPMGSTLAALRLTGDRFEAARIGDSRIYMYQQGQLTRLAGPRPSDAQPQNANGNPGEVQPAPPRRRTTQALGITPALELDAEPVTGRCAPGLQFLLCSDGLTEELDDARIAAILSRTDLAAQECVDHLVLAALDDGGRDNITALLVRIG
jgi:PPM family protein phosphatase